MSETAKNYTFRTLNATDIAPMCKIISKIGIDEFKKVFDSDSVMDAIRDAKGQANIKDVVGLQVFLEIANIVLAHIPDCETEIFTLLANVSGLKVNDIKALDLSSFTRMVIDFAKKEELKDFIGVVSELFK